MKISPSILASDLTNIASELEKLANAKADIIHLDIMDGHYVPNLTFGTPLIRKMRNVTNIPFDVHLMVTNPEAYIDDLAAIGGVEYISYHPETVFHNHRLITRIKNCGIKAGWAINPATPIDIIEPVYDDLDFILLMSVNPGFSGQVFISSVFEKLKKLSEISYQRMKKSSSDCQSDEESKANGIEIQVDGGVNDTNAPMLAQAGVNILVAGAYIFNSSDYNKAIQSLRY